MNIVNLITTGNLSEATSMFDTMMAEKSIQVLDSQKKIIAARFGLSEGLFDRFKKKSDDKTREKVLDSPSHMRQRERTLDNKRSSRSAKIKSGNYVMEARSKAERDAARATLRNARNKDIMEIPPKAELDAMAAKHKARVVKPTGSFTGSKVNDMIHRFLSWKDRSTMDDIF